MNFFEELIQMQERLSKIDSNYSVRLNPEILFQDNISFQKFWGLPIYEFFIFNRDERIMQLTPPNNEPALSLVLQYGDGKLHRKKINKKFQNDLWEVKLDKKNINEDSIVKIINTLVPQGDKYRIVVD